MKKSPSGAEARHRSMKTWGVVTVKGKDESEGWRMNQNDP